MNEDLRIIKKKYGEKMAHLCRELFPSILETKGLLPKLLLDHFDSSHMLYEDLINQSLVIDFKDYIYSLIEHKEKKEQNGLKTPKELLNEAGYNLYECKTEEDIQKFKKYYTLGERLCTFGNQRLNSCYVFFAVKKDVDNIIRKDFKNPKRQDLYGTSVISIQFTKDECHTLSIKNRYNHTVDNPDATFSNNLDNIVPGLTESFATFYGMYQNHFANGFELMNYVQANDGRLYKYNYEIDNVYYCPNNIIIDNFEVKRFEKEKYLIIDNFILNLMDKKIAQYRFYVLGGLDSFPNSIGEIEKIDIKNEDENKIIYITPKTGEVIMIKVDKYNRIINLTNNNVINIRDEFLRYNNSLTQLNLESLQNVGDDFLHENQTLLSLSLPNLKKTGHRFLYFNLNLNKLDLPNLQYVGNYFLKNNRNIPDLLLPKLKKVGNYFLEQNNVLEKLYLPELEEIGIDFISHNQKIKYVNLPKLKVVDSGFLYFNKDLEQIYFPELTIIYNCFLYKNRIIKRISLPKVQKIGNDFLINNSLLKEINLPELEEAGKQFLMYNNSLKSLYFPKLKDVGDYFLFANKEIIFIDLPKLQKVGDYCLFQNTIIEKANLPKLEYIGEYFLYLNNSLKKLFLPNLKGAKKGFLQLNKSLTLLKLLRLKLTTRQFFLERLPKQLLDKNNKQKNLIFTKK